MNGVARSIWYTSLARRRRAIASFLLPVLGREQHVVPGTGQVPGQRQVTAPMRRR